VHRGAPGGPQATRIRLLLREVRSLIGEVVAIAKTGRAAAPASGTAYAPLQEALAGDVEHSLAPAATMAEALEQALGVGAPQLRPARPAVSARLAELEELSRSLRPEQLEARYGALPPEAGEALRRMAEELDRCVRAARMVLHPPLVPPQEGQAEDAPGSGGGEG
jgi:hypothetical protein